MGIGIDNLLQHYWGVTGGAGATYQMGNVRWVLEAIYTRGMSNVANPTNRYSNNRLAGIGDVQDDYELDNISVSFGCLFPLRFLGKSFKSSL